MPVKIQQYVFSVSGVQPANPAFLETIGKLDVKNSEIDVDSSSGTQILRTRRTAVIDFSDSGEDSQKSNEKSTSKPPQFDFILIRTEDRRHCMITNLHFHTSHNWGMIRVH